MEGFKGTKGSWSLSKKWFKKRASCAWIEIRSEDGKVLAEAKGKHHGIPNEECEANAQLISKAPELLDFVNRISGEMLRNDFVLSEKWYEQAKQLIKQATEVKP